MQFIHGSVYDERYQKTYFYCDLKTRYVPAFLDYHKSWYVNKVKTVPKNLKLNAEIVATWLCDDGNISFLKNKRFKIVFHTQGFSLEDVEFLKKLLVQRYNQKFTIQKAKNDKYIIVTADKGSRAILKDVDSVFPESMTRKSDLWRVKSDNFYSNEPKLFGNRDYKEIITNVAEFIQNSNENFTIKSICLHFNKYYIDDKGNFAPFASIKRFLNKCIKEGIIKKVNIEDKNSFHTPLSKIKNINIYDYTLSFFKEKRSII